MRYNLPPSKPTCYFRTFLFMLQSPPSICPARSDGFHFTHSPTSLADLCHSSTDFLHNIIPTIHPVSPPCPPIFLCTLLLSDLNHSFSLHLPDPTVLMHCFSLHPLFTILTYDCFFYLYTDLAKFHFLPLV